MRTREEEDLGGRTGGRDRGGLENNSLCLAESRVEDVRNCSQLTLVDPATVDLTNPLRPADHVCTRTPVRVQDLLFSSCVRPAKQS